MALEIKILDYGTSSWNRVFSRARRTAAHAARAGARFFSITGGTYPIVVDTGYRSIRSMGRSACAGSVHENMIENQLHATACAWATSVSCATPICTSTTPARTTCFR